MQCFTGDMPRIIQVSDSHLSPNAPYADANWRAVVAAIDQMDVDLVVHTGDISLNGADDMCELVHARDMLDRLEVPWVAIPGNHDIGDFDDELQPVDEFRRRCFAKVFGDASWLRQLGDWRLIGLDVQTLLSDLDAAEALWKWLDDALRTDAPTALFIHRPLRPWRSDEADDPRRYVPEPSRSRLHELLKSGNVRLVASGHAHQWRHVTDSANHVWAPSTWAKLPDRVQPVIGVKTTGAVEHLLGAKGAVTSTLIRPMAIADVTVGDDFVSPYAH